MALLKCKLLLSRLALAIWCNYGISLAEKEPHATVVHVERTLEGLGAHRHLHTVLTVGLEDWPDAARQECDLVLLEKLPNSVFADSYEVQGLQRRGAYKRAHVFGDTNLERLASRSGECFVEIQAPTTKSDHHHRDFRLQTVVKLPVHARYPPASKDGYSSVHIPLPDVSVQCSNPRNEGSPLGQHVPVAWGNKLPEALVWRMPAGNPAHARFVGVGTALAAVVGVIAILIVCLSAYSHRHPISVHNIGRKLHLL